MWEKIQFSICVNPDRTPGRRLRPIQLVPRTRLPGAPYPKLRPIPQVQIRSRFLVKVEPHTPSPYPLTFPRQSCSMRLQSRNSKLPSEPECVNEVWRYMSRMQGMTGGTLNGGGHRRSVGDTHEQHEAIIVGRVHRSFEPRMRSRPTSDMAMRHI